MSDRVVLLLDGGFVKKKLQAKSHTFPKEQDILALVNEIMGKPRRFSRTLPSGGEPCC